MKSNSSPPSPKVSLLEDENGPLVVFRLPLQNDEGASSLSPALLDILGLVLAGQTRDQIAKERNTSISTISKQLYRLYQNFGVTSRSELVAQLMT